jgi:hypothetical protein
MTSFLCGFQLIVDDVAEALFFLLVAYFLADDGESTRTEVKRRRLFGVGRHNGELLYQNLSAANLKIDISRIVLLIK